MVLLLAIELNGGDALQNAVVCQVNVPLLEENHDEWAGRHQHRAPMAHTLGTECPGPPDAGVGQELSGVCRWEWNSLWAAEVGRNGDTWEKGESQEAVGVSPQPGLTSNSAWRQVPSPRNGATMSSVTGNLSGICVQRRIKPGLMPLRYWYPKKLSSLQCSATYSREMARERHDATWSPSGIERHRAKARD